MGLFDIFKPKPSKDALLKDMIAHNAMIILTTEEKTQAEAEYLSICLLIDDLSARPNGREGYKQIMIILERNFPQHSGDVITYVGWSTGKLKLKPEAEAALRGRHAK